MLKEKMFVEAQLFWKTLRFLCLTKLMRCLNNVKKAYFGISDVLHIVEKAFQNKKYIQLCKKLDEAI